MAKTQSIDVPDELKNLEGNALERRDRFVLGVVQGHKSLPSDERKKAIKAMSLFGYLATIWRTLTTAQKDVWRDAGVFSSLTNWQLFISDNAKRIKHDLTLAVPPSELWQVRTGYIQIASPASTIILKQEHPQNYYITQKIAGKPWKHELVFLDENFSLPLELEIRYKSNLTTYGAEQSARFYASIWSSYQGEDIETILEIPFSAVQDWKFETVETGDIRGIIIGYTLYIEVVGYRGTLAFDNLACVHGGTNWARDPRCDDVSKTFTKAFAVVPPFWIPVDFGDGVSFDTVYPPAL